MAPQHSA